jgi:hypothetical protein
MRMRMRILGFGTARLFEELELLSSALVPLDFLACILFKRLPLTLPQKNLYSVFHQSIPK